MFNKIPPKKSPKILPGKISICMKLFPWSYKPLHQKGGLKRSHSLLLNLGLGFYQKSTFFYLAFKSLSNMVFLSPSFSALGYGVLLFVLVFVSCKKDSDNTNPDADKLPVFANPTGSPISDITAQSARFAVTISGDGGSSITSRGVVWHTASNPTTALSTKTADSTGTGSFVATLSGLMADTKYYARAYATNAFGTAYGTQQTFTTLKVAASVTDIDGNIYPTVTIGSQVWMKENLKVSRFKNGDPVNNLSDSQWQSATTGAYGVYANSADNNNTYGKLYNQYAVADPRGLCPAGWHVPSSAELSELIGFLGGDTIAGGKMKAVSSLWISPNVGATNASGFTGLPGGYRSSNGAYNDMGRQGYWWSSTDLSSIQSWYRDLNCKNTKAAYGVFFKNQGLSVRCVQD